MVEICGFCVSLVYLTTGIIRKKYNMFCLFEYNMFCLEILGMYVSNMIIDKAPADAGKIQIQYNFHTTELIKVNQY